MEKYGTAAQVSYDNILRRMKFTCWITEATDTHSEYVILIVFCTATIVTLKRLIVTLYVHCGSCDISVRLAACHITD